MAKNLTNRVTLTTVAIKGQQPEQFTFLTKEAQEQFLYGLAVENWNLDKPVPGTRKGALEHFFNPAAGNSYKCSTVTQISNEAAQRIAVSTSTRVRQNSQKRERTGVGRTR